MYERVYNYESEDILTHQLINTSFFTFEFKDMQNVQDACQKTLLW